MFSTVHTALNTVVELTGTVMLAPVIPFDQTTVPLQPDAESVTFPPAHTEAELAVITGVLGSITVTVLLFEGPLVQSPTLHTAVKVVVVAGLTMIVVPTAPVDHVTVPEQPVAESVTL